jgi:hypothetical protein
MKRLQFVMALGLSLGLVGSAAALDLGGTLQNAASKAAKKGSQAVVESQINKDLEGMTCSCAGGKVDKKCLAKVAAKLKTEHTIAEKSGFSDFNIYIDADKKCSTSVEAEMTALVGWADTYVNTKKDSKVLTFSVKLN